MGDDDELQLPLLPASERRNAPIARDPPAVGTAAAHLAGPGVSEVVSTSILTPATGFTRRYKFTLNPYSGCRFGCEYCYARFFAPTLQAQEDWGGWVKVKQNAVALLRRARNAGAGTRRLEPGDAVYMSTVTDPYQPIEAKLGLTRSILEELLTTQPRLTIQTRSPLVVRDIDLLKQFERVRVNFTITTDSERVRLRYEPRCPSIKARTRAARVLAQADVPIGISVSPMLPIVDPEGFASMVADLGASEYVTQYLKPSRARFSAGSTAEALQKFETDGWTVEKYQLVRATLARALGPNRPLLEGDAGYAPA